MLFLVKFEVIFHLIDYPFTYFLALALLDKPLAGMLPAQVEVLDYLCQIYKEKGLGNNDLTCHLDFFSQFRRNLFSSS